MGGGNDVEGLLKSVGAGEVLSREREGLERGTGERNRRGGGGDRLWAAAAAVWVSLHSLAACPPGKVGYRGKELNSDTGKGASSH